MKFKLTNQIKVNKILQTFTNSKNKDSWRMDNALLKKFKDMFLTPITHITVFKRAIIIPVFISGNKQEVCNYRPISIRPFVSKVTETLI